MLRLSGGDHAGSGTHIGAACARVVGIRMAGPSVMLMKRIVGLPGETVAFEHGRLIINGEEMPEPYMKNHSPALYTPPVKLGPDEYYVIESTNKNIQGMDGATLSFAEYLFELAKV